MLLDVLSGMNRGKCMYMAVVYPEPAKQVTSSPRLKMTKGYFVCMA